jgi:dihydropyrimidinase
MKHMEAKVAREGRDQWYNLHLVHTNLSERIAFHSIISLARAAGVPLYLAHVTGSEGVAAIAAARAQGQPVFGEVLHNYLCYTADDYQRPGHRAITSVGSPTWAYLPAPSMLE